MLMKVKPLSANRILANHRFGSHTDSEPENLTPTIVAPRTLADLVAE
jgi:hypothetical protein